MSKSIKSLAILGALLAALAFTPAPASADTKPCADLASLKLPDTTIASATVMPAGPFIAPTPQAVARANAPAAGAPAAAAARPLDVPAFCRVQLTVAPTIKIEVWLPTSGWNGNFKGVGNGGMAGNVVYNALAAALQAGYATASTDTGHEAPNTNASFAFGASRNPDLLVDFGYRAIHEMTVTGKQITEAFYGVAPRVSYFEGCSQGGRQALTEAQRYPEDYDGIIAGAPGIDHTNLMLSNFLVGYATMNDAASYFPPAKLAAIQDAALAACDALDGVKDGLIDDPRKCNFDPAALLCKAGDSDTCLTAKQITALESIYAGFKGPDGNTIYEGKSPGTEKGWNNLTTGASAGAGFQYNLGVSYMRNWVFADPNWDLHSWNLSEDLPLVENKRIMAIMDSNSPDLHAFRDRGGKLIMYQGWGDDAVSPAHTIRYYKAVVASTTGVGKGTSAYTPEDVAFDHAAEQTGNFFRLFMFPGMNHCGGGSGPNVFKGQDAMANWVEHKQAPDKLIASHLTNNAVDRTRPECPYPMTAQYNGQGSIDDAANFSCKLPKAK